MPDRNGAMTMDEVLDAWKKDKVYIKKLERLALSASFYLARRGAGQDANAVAADIDKLFLGVQEDE